MDSQMKGQSHKVEQNMDSVAKSPYEMWHIDIKFYYWSITSSPLCICRNLKQTKSNMEALHS